MGAAEIAPGALRLGESYRIEISTRYETGATVIPGGSADYDGVVVRARRETPNGNGNGNGAGVDTRAGLVNSGATSAVADGKRRIKVKVRCSRLLEGACKIGLNGLVTRKGPKLTSRRHVRVKSGSAKVVSLAVKKRFRAKLGSKRSIYVRQTVRADKTAKTSVKKLRLRH